MSLHAQMNYQVPEETARVARAIFPQANLVMRMYDELGMVFCDSEFADLFPMRGQPAEAPARLALVTVLQFMEGLTDRQASDAVRTRIDWKYLLCLELTDPGFHHSVLSEFRTRLLTHGAERRLFDAIVTLARTRSLLKAGGRQRTDSTHILGAMRTQTRMEAVIETLRHALNVLADIAPDWLRTHTNAEWIDRYGPRANEYRLPKSDVKRIELAEQTGRDGLHLLTVIYADHDMPILRSVPAVETLRRVWVQNFMLAADKLEWRHNDNLPPARRYISSPYDTQARYNLKRTTAWTGYKVHLTETCEAESPNLITNVETTTAAVSDDAVTPKIHTALAEHDLLPDIHIADTGYVNSELFVASQERHHIELIGPTRSDNHWQAKEGAGFAASAFAIDWELEQAICPVGKASVSWTPAIDKFKNHVVKIKFATTDCQACPSSSKCTHTSPARRTITLRPQAQHQALLAARQREHTREFRSEYSKRAGIEGTIAQAVRSCALRRSRYLGLTKTHLQHLMTAAAMNIVRILNWLAGEQKAQSYQSRFSRLFMPAT